MTAGCSNNGKYTGTSTGNQSALEAAEPRHGNYFHAQLQSVNAVRHTESAATAKAAAATATPRATATGTTPFCGPLVVGVAATPRHAGQSTWPTTNNQLSQPSRRADISKPSHHHLIKECQLNLLLHVARQVVAGVAGVAGPSWCCCGAPVKVLLRGVAADS